MKFVIVAVLFALVVTGQSSVVPLGAYVGGVHLPVATAVHVAAAPAAVHVAAVPAGVTVAHPGPVQVVAGPAVVAAAPVVAAPVAHGGTFVAKTRGAVHVAPLPGHLASVASVNLKPAPGTW